MSKFWDIVDKNSGRIAMCFLILVVASCDVTKDYINKQDCTEVIDER